MRAIRRAIRHFSGPGGDGPPRSFAGKFALSLQFFEEGPRTVRCLFPGRQLRDRLSLLLPPSRLNTQLTKNVHLSIDCVVWRGLPFSSLGVRQFSSGGALPIPSTPTAPPPSLHRQRGRRLYRRRSHRPNASVTKMTDTTDSNTIDLAPLVAMPVDGGTQLRAAVGRRHYLRVLRCTLRRREPRILSPTGINQQQTGGETLPFGCLRIAGS